MEMIKIYGKRWFYGWNVLVASCFASFTTAAMTYAGSYIMTIMVIQEDFASGVVGYASSLRYACVAVMAAPIGKLIAKYGNRTIMLWGLYLQIVTLGILVLAPASQWLMGLSCVLAGVGTCAVVALGCPGIVKKWFRCRLTLPLSLALSASSLGGFILPQTAASVIEGRSWRAGWLMLLIMTVLSAAFLWGVGREDPAEIGEVPDGRAWQLRHISGTNAENEPVTSNGALKLIHNPSLLVYGAAFIAFSALYSCVVSYISMYTIERGFTEDQAAVVLSLVSLVGVVGKVFTTVLDRFSVPGWLVTFGMFLLQGVGGVLLLVIHSLPAIMAAAAIIGFGYNCCYATQPQVLSNWFGDLQFSAAFGWFISFIYIGCTIGPSFMALCCLCGRSTGENFMVLGLVVLFGSALCMKVLPNADKGVEVSGTH